MTYQDQIDAARLAQKFIALAREEQMDDHRFLLAMSLTIGQLARRLHPTPEGCVNAIGAFARSALEAAEVDPNDLPDVH
ncbi:MAG: hypothetical protein H6953_11750 [Chromatiaceae bacterium]|nr:hypothetical protein [Chromatiaceae bacterium]MCP5315979.1 hypothetical protein [Chromatiaceae bacterium]